MSNKRADKTRKALLQAFFDLVIARPYEEIKVSDIVERAGVGRSTLYEHFANKQAILATSLGGPFSILAAVVRQPEDTARLLRLLEHFWSNRILARTILTGALRPKTVAVLARHVEQQLRMRDKQHRAHLIIPTRLAAIQMAEALLAPITAWVTGEVRCTPEALALMLSRSALALRHAWIR